MTSRLEIEKLLRTQPYLVKEFIATGVATMGPTRMRGDSSEDQRDLIMRQNPHQKIPFAKVTDPKDRGWRDNTSLPLDEELLKEDKQRSDMEIKYPTEERAREEAERMKRALWARFGGPEVEIPIEEKEERTYSLESYSTEGLRAIYSELKDYNEEPETQREIERILEERATKKSSVTAAIEQQGIDPQKIHAQDDSVGTETPQLNARYSGIPEFTPHINRTKGWSSLAFKPLRDVDNQRFFPQAVHDKMPLGEAGKVRDDKMRRSGGKEETERYNNKEPAEVSKQRDPHQWYQYSTMDGKKKILEHVGVNVRDLKQDWDEYEGLPEDIRNKVNQLFETEHKKEGRTYKEEVQQNEQYPQEGMLSRVGFNVKPKKDTDAKEKLSPLPREAIKAECGLCKEVHEEKLECPLCQKSEVCSDFTNEIFTCPNCVYSLVRIPNQENLEIIVG